MTFRTCDGYEVALVEIDRVRVNVKVEKNGLKIHESDWIRMDSALRAAQKAIITDKDIEIVAEGF